MPDGIAIVGEVLLEQHHEILQTTSPDCLFLHMGLGLLHHQGELCKQGHGASGDFISSVFKYTYIWK